MEKLFSNVAKQIVVLALMLAWSLQSFTVSAINYEEPITYDGVRYSFHALSGYSNTGEIWVAPGVNYSGHVVIPQSFEFEDYYLTVTGIEDGAFKDCVNLTSISLPASVAQIGNEAFSGCTNLDSFVHGRFCYYEWAVFKDSGLSFVDINTMEVPNECFSDCKNLKEARIQTYDYPAYVQFSFVIGPRAFANCSHMELIEITDAEIVGEGAFMNCKSLPTCNFARNAVCIGRQAFLNCSSIESVEISALEVGGCAFALCENLREVNYSLIRSKDDWSLIYGDFNHYPDYVSINLGSFAYSGVHYITVGNQELMTDDWMDSRVPAKIEFGDVSIEDADTEAFDSFDWDTPILAELYEFNLNNGVIACNPAAILGNAPKLEKINFGATIRDIWVHYDDDLMFFRPFCGDVNNFGGFNVSEDNPYFSSEDGLLFNKDKTVLISCPSGKTEVNLPKTLTSLGDNSFAGCTLLKSVIIPEGVGSLGGGVFESCVALEEIVIPDKIKDLNDGTFTGCYNLKNVTLSENLERVGFLSFYYCISLEHITLPTSLKTIDILAFYRAKNLKEIEFPSGLNKIGTAAFIGCENLKVIKCNRTKPVEISKEASYNNMIIGQSYHATEAFNPDVYDGAMLSVPEESLGEYKKTWPWSEFKHINDEHSSLESPLEDGGGISIINNKGVIEVTGAAEGAEITVYNLSGSMVYRGKDTKISSFASGIYIFRVGDKVMKVLI